MVLDIMAASQVPSRVNFLGPTLCLNPRSDQVCHYIDSDTSESGTECDPKDLKDNGSDTSNVIAKKNVKNHNFYRKFRNRLCMLMMKIMKSIVHRTKK